MIMDWSAGTAPEGMEWQNGVCPNAGNMCHCTGVCRGRWVPVGTVKHCGTCRCTEGGE